MNKSVSVGEIIIIFLLIVIIFQLGKVVKIVEYIDWDVRQILGKMVLKGF